VRGTWLLDINITITISYFTTLPYLTLPIISYHIWLVQQQPRNQDIQEMKDEKKKKNTGSLQREQGQEAREQSEV
jgi:hypothetical protein